MKTNKIPCYIVTAALILGIVLELAGGLTFAGMESVGFNTAIPPLMIVGIVLVVTGFAAHLILKLLQKTLNLDPVLLDVEAIVAIIAVFFAVIYLVCFIVWPVLFPENG